MTRYAKLVVDLMRRGLRLRVPRDGGRPSLIEGLRRINPRGAMLSHAVAAELISSGLLWKYTEHAESERLGWRAAGLEAAARGADLYTLIDDDPV